MQLPHTTSGIKDLLMNYILEQFFLIVINDYIDESNDTSPNASQNYCTGLLIYCTSKYCQQKMVSVVSIQL